MGNLRGTMPGRPGPGKHLWHGESVCPHAAKSGLGCRKTGAQKLTKCKHAIPIPVCSQINNCDGDQLWKYRAQGCGRTRRPVARIPQITSVDPGNPRPTRTTSGDGSRRRRISNRAYRSPRAYQQIKKIGSKTACPSSKAESIRGTIRSRWAKTPRAITNGT